MEITRRHKQEMTAAMADMLPPSRQCKAVAEAVALAVDGAIIRAQFEPAAEGALAAVDRILRALSDKRR